MNWKYLKNGGAIVWRLNADGTQESCSVSSLPPGTPITPADAPTKPELKASALIGASALGFSLDQLRVIRAIVMLMNGTPAQKTKAAALLQPLVKLAGDARRISDQIEADLPPDVLAPPIIPTDDP